MASYNLNEVLKAKAANTTENNTGEVKLDDVTRVKVLSPGRAVAKRFVRNRLAITGLVILIVMFVFSFLGPLVYPYGQKDIFYKYESEKVNYSLAKENTTYNGYVFDDSVELGVNAVNNMNSVIKDMIATGDKERISLNGDSYYLVKELGKGIYTLGKVDTKKTCDFGSIMTKVGTYTVLDKQFKYAGEEIGADFVAMVQKSCKGSAGSFEFNGVEYTFEKGSGVKSYDVSSKIDSFAYEASALGEGFEAEAYKTLEAKKEQFSFGGKTYAVAEGDEGINQVYEIGKATDAMVFTNYMINMKDVAEKYSDEFKVNLLLNAYNGGKFEADGKAYTVQQLEDNTFVINDAEGNEYADLNTFVIRRYNGDDTMEYDLKTAIFTEIERMNEANELTGKVAFDLPMQNEVGEYSYDEEGNLMYNTTELVVNRKDLGEYVITCEQVIYKIDIYASPTSKHPLGTDGDGFDVMSRIMYGGRISLLVGFVVVFIETFLGIIMGGLAGFYGGWVDNLVMRLVDIFYCLPSTPIMIILGAMMDAMRMDTYIRLMIMMAALGIMGWAGIARMVRGQILSLREQEFMVAAEATGVKVKDRIFRHLVPNVMPQLIVSATMGMGGTILTESTLSFLGLGVKHPLATWGTIINSVSSASAMAHYTNIWIPVGFLICLTVIAFNFVGDGLRDAYDPKGKR